MVALGAILVGCQNGEPATLDPIGITSVDHLDWLAGHWIQQSADGATTNEELWLAPAGGMMLGVNRTVREGSAIAFEYLMIRELDGRIAYLSMPGARTPPTVFPLSPGSADRVVIFENPNHDFPQRIVYALEGDQLTATLTGSDEQGERTETWRWRRVK